MKWLAVVLQALREVIVLLLARADAKQDARREGELEATVEALKQERKRDEIDRDAAGGSARDRLRSKWTRPD